MSGLVPSVLSTRSQTASEVYHAILLKASLTRLGDRAALEPERFESPGEDLAWLLSMPAFKVVRQSTPFVWLNAHRLAVSNSRGEVAALVFARHLAMTSFDAYYQIVPDGTTVRLRGIAHCPVILLPSLGVQVRTGSCDSILVRRSATTLTIDTSENCICLNLRALDPESRLKASPIPLFPSSQFLSVRDHALFEEEYFDELVTEETATAIFPQAISDALATIATIDPELESRISSVIRWYVAIRSLSPQIHCSFTSTQLKGIIFLSYTSNEIVLAEAIVHEFGHTELNFLMDTQLLTSSESDKRFYSPWRTDPRPLTALIHALYVFSGVADFLTRAAGTPTMAKYCAYIQAQRLAIYHKLRLGLKQVPQEELTPLGHDIIEDIARRLRLSQSDMVHRVRQTPDWIYNHLSAWKAEHPELEVKMP